MNSVESPRHLRLIPRTNAMMHIELDIRDNYVIRLQITANIQLGIARGEPDFISSSKLFRAETALWVDP